jgi:hypothetical protein
MMMISGCLNSFQRPSNRIAELLSNKQRSLTHRWLPRYMASTAGFWGMWDAFQLGKTCGLTHSVLRNTLVLMQAAQQRRKKAHNKAQR